MAKRKICQAMAVVLALGMCTTGLTGCGNEKRADGKLRLRWFLISRRLLRLSRRLRSNLMRLMMIFI